MARVGSFNLLFLLVEAEERSRAKHPGFNFIVRKRRNALFAEMDWNTELGAEPCVSQPKV
jgi:hypothetical protein